MTAAGARERRIGYQRDAPNQEEMQMTTATQAGQAALQGWRKKVADTVAEPVAGRTGMDEEQVRALVGTLFFALSVLYVVKTLRGVARER